jgi:O-antigen/teichoic acid export membrane protein
MLKFIKKNLWQGRNLITFSSARTFGETIIPLLIAKLYNSEAFGNFSLAKIIVFFFFASLVNPTRNAYIVFSSHEKSDSGRINKTFSAQCLFTLFSIIIFIILIFLISPFIMEFAAIDYNFIPYMIFAFLGLLLKALINNTFLATGERMASAYFSIAYSVINVFCITFFYYTNNLTIQMIFLSYGLSAITSLAVFFWFIKRSLLFPFTLDKKHIYEMLNFIKWVFVGSTAIYFLNWGDSMVLRHYNINISQIGIYNFGYTLFKGILALIVTISNYFLPFISQNLHNKEIISNFLFKKRVKLLILGLSGICIAFILMPYITGYFGDTYKGSETVTRILLIAAGMHFYSIFYQPLINAAKKSRVSQFISITQVIVNITLDFILIPHFGVLGAAIATSIGYTIRAIITEIYYRLILKKFLFHKHKQAHNNIN